MTRMDSYETVGGWTAHRLVRSEGKGTQAQPMVAVCFTQDEWAAIRRTVFAEVGLMSLAAHEDIVERISEAHRETTHELMRVNAELRDIHTGKASA